MSNINQIISYQPDFSAVVAGFKDLASLNARLSAQLQTQLGSAFDVKDLNITKITNSLDKLGNPQQLGKFSATIKDTSGNLKILSSNFKIAGAAGSQTADSIKIFGQSISDSKKQTGLFGLNLLELAKRAAFTIPIWFALRTAIIGIPQALAQGAKDLLAFDKAMQKVRRNLTGSASEIEANFQRIRDAVTQTSKETGISTEELAEAVKKFATIGFDANEALQGGLGAAKLSVLLFGDAGDTADAFARALKLLIDRSDGAKNAADQMNDAFALTAQLEQSNQFEIKEVTESLLKFGGTAKAVGLSTKETLSVLAALGTAGRAGAQGGTLLSSSFNELITNLPQVASSLGLVRKQGESTFTTFTRILDKVEELNKQPGGQAVAVAAISDIFGGQRGLKAVQSLAALNQQLKANLAITPDVAKFNKAVQDVLDTESGQARILGNNLKELGKSFVSTFFGADNFKAALKDVNKTIQEATPALLVLANVLGLLGEQAAISLKTLESLITLDFKGLGDNAVKQLQLINDNFNPFNIAVTEAGRGVKEFEKTFSTSTDKIIAGLKGKLGQVDLEKLIVGIRSGEILIPKDLNGKRLIESLEKRLNAQVQGQSAIVTIDTSIEPALGFKDIQDISKLVLQNQLDILKTQGASNSQLLKAELSWSKQLGIVEEADAILSKQLAKEKALTEEKRLQSKLSSDSIKLFEIAQTAGVDAAKKIGDVLAGNTDFDTFFRQGGKDLEIFKKEFGDLFKAKQAESFFKGDFLKGFQELRGGTNVAINDRAALGGNIPAFNPKLSIAEQRAVNQVPKINAEINSRIQVAIELTGKFNIRDEVRQALKEQAANPESDFNKEFNKKLFGSPNVKP